MKCSSGQQTEKKQFLRVKLKDPDDKQVLLFLLGDSYFLASHLTQLKRGVTFLTVLNGLSKSK